MSDLFAKMGSIAGRIIGRDGRLAAALRPAYERLLDLSSGGRGVAWRFNGEPIRIDPRVRRWIPPTGEPEVMAKLVELTRPGEQILDVGSFLGTYAVLLARWSAPGGRVLAFEPTPSMVPFVRRHLALNDVEDTVTLLPVAVGAQEGKARFVLHSDPFRNAIGAADPAGEAVESVDVPVVTLDRICAEHRFEPTLVRMDVQGLERAVLEGARKLIAARGRELRILLEVHPQLWHLHGFDERDFDRLLDELALEATPLTRGAPRYEPDGHLLLEHA